MGKNKDEIFEASKIACDTWNSNNPKFPVAIGVISYHLEGYVIFVDGKINFYRDGHEFNGLFKIGNYKTSFDDPMELVYAWLECIEECYNAKFE
ncbi:hypothetical protein HOS86_gp112 [Klebsiella phage vB_KpnM_KpS110]|uniref:Uncharacterized protein n=1 Tax=Klebsiella phage vB_KpnM_KpS110 TaxID=2079262 RepID=A0A2K9VAR5_9CAUD|nr:hypothetical protein HOS86_gp112 [Klebsiella phage vB_KpnM_KpS110]AUV59310.1 hypothetical protein kps110_194 [Klebsiella phage vB_KpnM_KpS110]